MNQTVAARLRVPDFDDVASAAQRLKGAAVRTPLLRSDALDAATGGALYVKAENLQRGGAFKFRGAYNAISKLSSQERERGIVAYSSGNHAIGVAEAARLCGTPATILIPKDAPPAKAERVAALGAWIRTYDRERDDREAAAKVIAEESGGAVIPPFDHPDVIAGQGTLGLEVIEETRLRGVRIDTTLCCVGGGGLIAGLGAAFAHLAPEALHYGVEPAGFDDMRRSLVTGRHESNDQLSGSICDALMAPKTGELTYSMNSVRLSGGLAVTDAEVCAAMSFAFHHLKLVLEPSGAVGLAAALTGKLDLRDRVVLVVASGGNIDVGTFARLVNTH